MHNTNPLRINMVLNLCLRIIVVGILPVFAGCANQPLTIAPDDNVTSIGICLGFNEHIHADEKLLYLNATKEYVETFNQGNPVLKIDTCNMQQAHRLEIIVQNTRFIEPSEQALYAVLSTAGVIYPLTGGGVGFVWFGLSTSNLEVKPSKSLSGVDKVTYMQFYSSPYFKTSEGVRVRHMESYKEFVGGLVQEIIAKLKAKPFEAEASANT